MLWRRESLLNNQNITETGSVTNIRKLTFYIRGRNDQGLGAKRPGSILEAKRLGGWEWFGSETSCYLDNQGATDKINISQDNIQRRS